MRGIQMCWAIILLFTYHGPYLKMCHATLDIGYTALAFLHSTNVPKVMVSLTTAFENYFNDADGIWSMWVRNVYF